MSVPPIEFPLFFLTVFATAVMAASAAVQAVRCEFDLVGAMFLAVITAVGGGTLRDLLIGATPVFWLRDHLYLSISVPIGLVTFHLVGKMQVGTGRRLKLLAYFDAVGLALFTLVGAKVATTNGVLPPFAVLLGCLTGIGGGMFRDVLCGITPIVLRKDIYATLSLIGAALYFGLQEVWSEQSSFLAAFLWILLTRVFVVAREPTAPESVINRPE